MLDRVDRRILRMLQANARISNAEIARRLGMVPSAALARVRKLARRGVIRGHHTELDPGALGLGLLAFIYIKTNDKRSKWDVGKIVSEIPGVLEVHDVAGEDCYLVKLRTRDTDSLFHLLRDELSRIPAIASTRTTIALRTSKETTQLPVEEERTEAPTQRRRTRSASQTSKVRT